MPSEHITYFRKPIASMPRVSSQNVYEAELTRLMKHVKAVLLLRQSCCKGSRGGPAGWRVSNSTLEKVQGSSGTFRD